MKCTFTYTTLLVLSCITLLHFASCYGINEKTTNICSLNTICLTDSAWTTIKRRYDVSKIHDDDFISAAKDIDTVWRFRTETLYFDSGPKELIAVATDLYSVRYCYSPRGNLFTDKVLDGLSPELTASEKMRIRNRIQSLFLEFQCEEGKMQSYKLMSEKIE